MEKDKARMAQVFLELDDDADGLWVLTLSRTSITFKKEHI